MKIAILTLSLPQIDTLVGLAEAVDGVTGLTERERALALYLWSLRTEMALTPYNREVHQ